MRRRTVVEPDLSGLLVDARHGREQGGDVRPVAQQMPDRPGDLRGRERSGRHLIKQRLEEMMVAPVHERDAHRSAAKSANGLQSAEAGADNHNVTSRV